MYLAVKLSHCGSVILGFSLYIASMAHKKRIPLDICSLYLLSYVQDGASPLYIASQGGHIAVVDILIKAGADVHQARTMV